MSGLGGFQYEHRDSLDGCFDQNLDLEHQSSETIMDDYPISDTFDYINNKIIVKCTFDYVQDYHSSEETERFFD